MKNIKMKKYKHPWEYLIQEIRDRNWTQKQFSLLAWKKVSEVNELIKWKRNITIQRDLILSNVLWSPEKYWMNKQIDYDYYIAKEIFDDSKIKEQKSIIKKIESKNIIKEKNKKNEDIFNRF